jgi:type II secretory pathway pseudopilin PulG
MLELVIACAIAFTVMAMAMLAMQPSWQQFQATAAMDQIKTVLREARETAISQRRTVAVQFQNNNTIALYSYVINYPVGDAGFVHDPVSLRYRGEQRGVHDVFDFDERDAERRGRRIYGNNQRA